MATEFERRLQGARLLTAEVLYYMPDHPSLLQTFMWQFLDEARREVEAVIHSVRIASGEPLSPPGWRKVDGLIRMH